jgi:hypothetical protein
MKIDGDAYSGIVGTSCDMIASAWRNSAARFTVSSSLSEACIRADALRLQYSR